MPVGLGCLVWCEGNPACDRPGQVASIFHVQNCDQDTDQVDQVLDLHHFDGRSCGAFISGSLSLYATNMQILKIPPDVKQIAKVLEAVTKRVMTESEAAQALRCSQERFLQLFALHIDQTDDYKRELRQQVFALTGGKEGHDGKVKPPPSTRQRKAKVSKMEMLLLDHMEHRLKVQGYEPPCDTWIPQSMVEVEGFEGPCTLETIPDAASTRGPLSRSEYFHSKKWPQIRWFLGRLDEFRRAGVMFKHVLDVGGGRGDLAIHIASAFGVKVTVIDTSESSLEAGQEAASQKNLHNCHFRNMDFRVAAKQLPDDVDMVVALHACGGLSDAALNFAWSRHISFVICPCCHLKHQHLEPLGGWSSLCDIEARSMLPTDEVDQDLLDGKASQILRRLAEIDRRDIAWRALYIIAALRLQVIRPPVDKYVATPIFCTLATFAHEYSSRTGPQN